VRLGIFGGSFDPVHHAHVIVAQLAREQLALDRVLFVVAGSQPFKSGHHVARAEDRLRMVELALEGVPGLAADGRELRRAGPSFSIDTLRELAADFPGSDLTLLLGADAAAGFNAWRDPEAIRAVARIAVFRRGGSPAPAGFDFLVDVPALDLSATVIRARAAAGRSLAGWVPAPVADYIARLRIYGSTAE
jgi:nicotinate-nucleotide adenylyltransferase